MNIVVTGASRGIGFELVKQFAKDESNRVVAISRNQERLERLKEECMLANPGANVIPLAIDLASDKAGIQISEYFKNQKAGVDILINNAGAIVNKPFDQLTAVDFDNVFNVNVKGVMLLVQSLRPYFKAGSHIVNIGSMGGYQGSVKFPGLSLYSASKGALAILSECLAEEFKSEQIYVNCLALGAVQTEMLSEAFPDYKAPLSSREMAEFMVGFAQTGHHFFNGKILPVSISTP
ncbi:MAG: SDR family oxidoreductase [Bacteroidetes bacterium]|nr:SDR family oxidoreductase [Bacteroidota bacterium]